MNFGYGDVYSVKYDREVGNGASSMEPLSLNVCARDVGHAGYIAQQLNPSLTVISIVRSMQKVYWESDGFTVQQEKKS